MGSCLLGLFSLIMLESFKTANYDKEGKEDEVETKAQKGVEDSCVFVFNLPPLSQNRPLHYMHIVHRSLLHHLYSLYPYHQLNLLGISNCIIVAFFWPLYTIQYIGLQIVVQLANLFQRCGLQLTIHIVPSPENSETLNPGKSPTEPGEILNCALQPRPLCLFIANFS